MKKLSKITAVALSAGFLLAATGCTEEEEFTVYLPDGAPAIAFAGLMSADTEGDGISYRVVPPASITDKVTNRKQSKNADLCVLPLTAASKRLGDGKNYTMLGTVTHGNLYLIAKSGEEVDSLTALLGKKVGVLQIKEVPGLTFKATLAQAGVAYQEVSNGETLAADKVNLLAISGADAVGVTEADYFLLAEPAATAQSKKNYEIVGDLQALYGKGEGYPQAVLVAKSSLVEEKPVWVENLVEKLEGSIEWALRADGDTLVSVVQSHMENKSATSLKAPLLTEAVLGRCGLRFSYAAEERSSCEDLLTAMLEVNSEAGRIPSRNFYWSYTK